VAAVLYGVGVLLDAQPELFFTLRSVDGEELLATSREEMVQDLRAESEGGLEGEDLSALFGIDLGH
jgi:uncharacterized Zn finger protein